MSSGGIESAHKEKKFKQNENYASALLLALLYVILAFYFLFITEPGFQKKKRCVQLYATDCK